MSDFPTSAKAVIVGGGIIGCSTAYHLCRLGWDVVLLERKKLTSGTTFHAAGLVGQLRSSANITQLLGYSVDLYKKLEAETGQATGWKMNGGLRLACNEERWTEVKRQATTAHSFGLEMELLTPKEAQELWPLMQVDDVVGAAFMPTDGQANPSDITLSLAKGARMGGAQIFEDTKVTKVIVEKGVIKGVETDKGRIDCGVVIACCGQWTREFAKQVGVNVPLVSVEHQYMVTEPIDGVTSDMPTLRDPDRLTYYKEEVGGLVMGGYEKNPIMWAQNGIPKDFHYTLLDSNFDHFEQLMELSLGRVPALETAGIKTLTNGPESFTPDGNFILGEAPELRNFYVGAGFNAFGIAAGGGAGMALAEWVANGSPPYDLWSVDIRRFGAPHFDTDWVRARTYEAYGKHYTMAWPSEEHDSGRPCRKSPLYDTLKSEGAVFGEKLGWERPNWYADTDAGEVQHDIYTFDRPNWHSAVAREHKAAREAAVLFDQTSFAKFVLKGPDAEDALSWIAANDVTGPVGTLTYTQMLNDQGGIECDLTAVRRAEDEFYIVTGTGFATHDFDHIARNIPDGMNAQLFDVTSAYAVLSLFGPRARDILQSVTRSDVSDAAFPFGTAQTIGIAACPVNALRVTYVGELGWELHLPVEYAVTVYEALHRAGAKHGLRNAGYRALETLRLEKGYRAWSSDIGPDHTPDEAGLGWAVKLKKNIDFKGRAAVEAQRAKGVAKRMTTFTADPDVILSGRETIYRNGVRVGWLSSAGYGHALGQSIGMGYVRNPDGVSRDYVLEGEYELEVATKRVPAKAHLAPLYDPRMEKVKC
ncbi:GcvT family protein [Roseovarius pelagicus]|uniref:FAD-dependent oxidoreductase n=1 Tax=Roseovarius pelagicus TaxID=2980108 RepID=A0ABY6DC89_9RHOB|nr:FAD-dependent oxidoreductase [Roseovarius pelagicus]UXX83469.1 FAD-dependent oxidoreductase [Roseovarius pelagicus]